MDTAIFENIKNSISEERLAVYCADGADKETTIARYIYSIELCKNFKLYKKCFVKK